MNPGFYYNMPFVEYQAIEALNGSALIKMARSPMFYKWSLDHPQPQTPEMALGTATHKMILEPNTVNDFAVWGEADGENVRRGKVWDAFKAANADKHIVTAKERDAMIGQTVMTRKNPLIARYLNKKGPTEVVMVWKDYDSAGGRLYKGRVDKIIPDEHTIVDLKGTRDCHPYRFGGQAYSLKMHIKMAMYWSGYRALTGKEPKMRLVAVDNKAPHEAAVYRVTKDVLIQGQEDWQNLVKRLAECEKTDSWPAEMDEESDLILPSYAYSDADDMAEFSMEGEE